MPFVDYDDGMVIKVAYLLLLYWIRRSNIIICNVLILLCWYRMGSGDVNQHAGAGGSDVESDDENEDGDYTVFECPGLATVRLAYLLAEC